LRVWLVAVLLGTGRAELFGGSCGTKVFCTSAGAKGWTKADSNCKMNWSKSSMIFDGGDVVKDGDVGKAGGALLSNVPTLPVLSFVDDGDVAGLVCFVCVLHGAGAGVEQTGSTKLLPKFCKNVKIVSILCSMSSKREDT